MRDVRRWAAGAAVVALAAVGVANCKSRIGHMPRELGTAKWPGRCGGPAIWPTGELARSRRGAGAAGQRRKANWPPAARLHREPRPARPARPLLRPGQPVRVLPHARRGRALVRREGRRARRGARAAVRRPQPGLDPARRSTAPRASSTTCGAATRPAGAPASRSTARSSTPTSGRASTSGSTSRPASWPTSSASAPARRRRRSASRTRARAL